MSLALSQSLPKAVPRTREEILAGLPAVLERVAEGASDREGIEIRDDWDGMGQRLSASVHLDNV